MKHSIALIFVCCSILTGCGYFVAGQWSDDPKNWERAFREAAPIEGVEIVHSWYMRTPHWTTEFAWFFELKVSTSVKNRILGDPLTKLVTGFSKDDFERRTYYERPHWFITRGLEHYDVYQSGTSSDFLIFMDKDSDMSYWTSYQL